MGQLLAKTPYRHDEPTIVRGAVQNSSIDFAAEMHALQTLLEAGNTTAYEAKLGQLAAFIMQNSSANSPSSLRAALQLPASDAFAAWSDETARTELAFCNTTALNQL